MTPRQYRLLLDRADAERQWEDFLTARIESLHANLNRDSKKRKQPFKVADFMVTGKPQKRKNSSPEEMLQQVEFITKMFGGTTEMSKD